jgi:hypothetical protein
VLGWNALPPKVEPLFAPESATPFTLFAPLPKALPPKPPNDLLADISFNGAAPFVGGKLAAGAACAPNENGVLCVGSCGAEAPKPNDAEGFGLKFMAGGFEGGPGEGEPRRFGIALIL